MKLKRENELGILMVVGGPGSSGVSTIAKALARHYSLAYIYAGLFMRNMAKDEGFKTVEDFLRYIDENDLQGRYDYEIDSKMIQMSFEKNTLIDSKVFAALSLSYDIPCTVKIWIDCDLDGRVRRSFEKEGKAFKEDSSEYIDRKNKLLERYNLDKKRYEGLYGIDYSNPKKYNDIVVDSSRLDVKNTFELVVKRIKDGGYIK
ncbi:MAG TPA: AAA family ATPase [Candidatus Dojkabacteria bacterium]|nr:AAA family ATPase [Candidatus Dojkabacteria bacterium]